MATYRYNASDFNLSSYAVFVLKTVLRRPEKSYFIGCRVSSHDMFHMIRRACLNNNRPTISTPQIASALAELAAAGFLKRALGEGIKRTHWEWTTRISKEAEIEEVKDVSLEDQIAAAIRLLHSKGYRVFKEVLPEPKPTPATDTATLGVTQ